MRQFRGSAVGQALLIAFVINNASQAAEAIKSVVLRQELLRRMTEDQDARKAFMALMESGQIKSLDGLKEEELPEVIRLGRDEFRQDASIQM
jgi:hypothetical protein